MYYVNYVKPFSRVGLDGLTADQRIDQHFGVFNTSPVFPKGYFEIITKPVEKEDIRFGAARTLGNVAHAWANSSAAIFKRKMLLIPDASNYAYHTFTIPKHSGGFRTIEIPAPFLKGLQQKALKCINRAHVLPHNAAHAYVANRGVLTAMATHKNANAKWFLKVDIEDFFGSINEDIIKTYLFERNAPFVDKRIPTRALDRVKVFTDLVLNPDGVLPQGAPTSPAISNLVMTEFDFKLTQTLQVHNPAYTYTRYADDIIVSSPYNFKYTYILSIIKRLLDDLFCGMIKIKDSKTRYGSCNGRNWNLGLMYNKDHNITLGHRKKKLLHAKVHNLLCNNPTVENLISANKFQKIRGELSWLYYVEADYYNSMKTKYLRKHPIDCVNTLFNIK